MEEFYLEEPSLTREKDVIAYVNEHSKYASNMEGSSFFICLLSGDSYYDCLIKENNISSEEFANSVSLSPGKTYFFIRRLDNKLVGMINIRHNLIDSMKEYEGNISFGIRPTERNKKYSEIMLYFGLKKALDDFNLENVLLSSEVDNVYANKAILALGGELQKCDLDKSKNAMTNVYHINVKKSIEEHSDEYEKYKKSN